MGHGFQFAMLNNQKVNPIRSPLNHHKITKFPYVKSLFFRQPYFYPLVDHNLASLTSASSSSLPSAGVSNKTCGILPMTALLGIHSQPCRSEIGVSIHDVCMFVCLYVFIYLYIYIYVHMDISILLLDVWYQNSSRYFMIIPSSP